MSAHEHMINLRALKKKLDFIKKRKNITLNQSKKNKSNFGSQMVYPSQYNHNQNHIEYIVGADNQIKGLIHEGVVYEYFPQYDQFIPQHIVEQMNNTQIKQKRKKKNKIC